MSSTPGPLLAGASVLWTRFLRLMDAAAALLLLALAVMTLIDVAGRELNGLYRFEFFVRWFGKEQIFTPLKGADEWTVIFMATSTYAVFAGITWRQEHVAVDLIDMVYPRRLIGLREFVINLGAAAFLATVAWALWQRADRTAEGGDVFQYLRFVRAPFISFFTIMAAITALALFANAIRYLLGRGPLQSAAPAADADRLGVG
ncbi:MAG: TRAP transporter small permease subunit [Rhodospirillaceae bacterium]|nr:TRAP transporter small permease subunit [Rhodospirillaceae bacterium]